MQLDSVDELPQLEDVTDDENERWEPRVAPAVQAAPRRSLFQAEPESSAINRFQSEDLPTRPISDPSGRNIDQSLAAKAQAQEIEDKFREILSADVGETEAEKILRETALPPRPLRTAVAGVKSKANMSSGWALESSSAPISINSQAPRGGPQGVPQKGKIQSLRDVPKNWWVDPGHEVDDDNGGYQYMTRGNIGAAIVEILVDGCAGVNSVSEELVVGVISAAYASGIKPDDKAFPVVQLERRRKDEAVTGTAKGKSVPIIGSVVLRVSLAQLNLKLAPAIWVRARILGAGFCDWQGLILGGRSIDCQEHGGLGHRTTPHAHAFDSLGILCPRIEWMKARPDDCYAYRLATSAVDSGSDDDSGPPRLASEQSPEHADRNCKTFASNTSASEDEAAGPDYLVYDGEDIVVEAGEGVWVPVTRNQYTPGPSTAAESVLPVKGAIEAVPGIWRTGALEGVILVANLELVDLDLSAGMVVAAIAPVTAQTRVCMSCHQVDTDAWVLRASKPQPQCQDCHAFVAGGDSACRACGAESVALGYTGCSTCRGVCSIKQQPRVNHRVSGSQDRPTTDRWEKRENTWVRVHVEPRSVLFNPEGVAGGPDAATLSRKRHTTKITGEEKTDDWKAADRQTKFGNQPWTGETRFWNQGSERSGPYPAPIMHIKEDPGKLDYLAEVLTPTEYYYDALRADLAARHPDASPHVLDHLVSVEAFLDKSIASGFSFGVDKAQVLVIEGKLLGHVVSRNGSSPDGERVQAIKDFAPLKEKLHIQQFLGSTNWLRQYLVPAYASCVKILGEYMKPEAVFPAEGLGPGSDRGSLAARAVKAIAAHYICLEVMDEAAAIDGSRPLEQVADSCGFAWGGSVLQMRADLSSFKVLMTASKGLTPAQQAWTPLTLEGFAQLETKRAQRRVLGCMKSLCWTDHANWTKQVVSEEIDVKHLRWTAEIIAEGPQIRSLSGRAAKLGDGFSRNPSGRDELLKQRTKDLEGLAGQARGFKLEEFLGDWEDDSYAFAWTMPSDSVPEKKDASARKGLTFGGARARRGQD